MKASEPPILGRHLVIVHDNDSSLLSRSKARWQRLRGPDAATCALCRLTEGVRGPTARWQGYLDSLSEPVHTLNRDTFRAAHASSSWRNIDVPTILLQTGPTIEKLVSAAEIRRSTTVHQLMDRLTDALRRHPA